MKTVKAAKADFQGGFAAEVREKNSRLFPVDFDDSHFESFSKFKLNRNEAAGEKQKVKSELSEGININSPKSKLIKYSIERIQRHFKENPNMLERWPEFKDPKFIRRHAINQIAEQKRELKAAARKRAKNVAAILKEFETSSYCDQLNLNNQSKVKDNIRAILLEYLTDEAVFFPHCSTLTSKRFQLTESQMNGRESTQSLCRKATHYLNTRGQKEAVLIAFVSPTESSHLAAGRTFSVRHSHRAQRPGKSPTQPADFPSGRSGASIRPLIRCFGQYLHLSGNIMTFSLPTGGLLTPGIYPLARPHHSPCRITIR